MKQDSRSVPQPTNQTMRIFYLLVILGLVIFMTSEFKKFEDNYDFVENQLNFMWSHCDNLKGAQVHHIGHEKEEN